MRCGQVRERFHEYAQGTLKGGDLQSFQEHLQSCQDCRSQLDSFRNLDARLRSDVPRFWESIEPAPDFMARLKQSNMEAPQSFTTRMAAVLSELWSNHRIALATSLSICIVIALAFTVPKMLPTHDEGLLVSKVIEEVEVPATKGVIKEVPVEREVVKEVVKEVPVEKVVEKGVFAQEAMKSPAVASGGHSTETPAYTAEQEALAITIAMEDSEVQEMLKDKNHHIIGLQEFACDTDDFSWSGPAVIIALEEEPSTPEVTLHICIDLDEHQVVRIIRLPEDEAP